MPSIAISRSPVEAPLIDSLWPRASGGALRYAALALAGSLLLWLSAKIQVPLWPVPMTMQSFVVLLIGAGYGLRLGGATVALYLAEGALGLPVLAGTPEKGVGLAYMMGPTGGYLVGFLLAVVAMGRLAERGWLRDWKRGGALLLIGSAIPLALGWAWLATFVGAGKAFALGVAPFLVGGAVKLALAASLLPLARRAPRPG